MSPASMNALVLAEVVQVALPAARTTTLTTAGVDTLGYDGLMKAVLHAAKGTGNADNTLDGKFQESDVSGSGYVDITGATFTQVLGTGGTDALQGITLDRKTKRYVRFVGTIAGTTPSFVFGVTLLAMKKYRP